MQLLTTFTVEVKSICRSHTRTVVRECRQQFTAYTPERIFTQNISNDVVPGKEVPFGGLDDYIFYLDP